MFLLLRLILTRFLHSILGASFDAKEITEISNNLKTYVESEALGPNATIPKRVLDRINKKNAKSIQVKLNKFKMKNILQH